MLREVSNIELGLWFADLRMGSIDDDRADVRTAVLATAAMNGPHFLKSGKKPYVLSDFLPERERPDVAKQVLAFFTPKMKRGK